MNKAMTPLSQNNVIYLQTIRDRKILEVHVDKGMVDGQKITFGGEGDQEPGLEPGDIIIVLDEKEHDVYK
jgi:DnaJ family protein A protein 1